MYTYMITDLSRYVVTSCYELEMLDEHTASGSLFESINLQQNTSTPTPPPPPPLPRINQHYKKILSFHFIITYGS